MGPYSVNLNMCLTARALGAAEIIFIGRKDQRLPRYMGAVNAKWGGSFKVKFMGRYAEAIKSASRYAKVNLTRFGVPLKQKIYQLRTYKNILLIVSLKDEAGPIHRLSDFNISISSQPHSCTASIAVFLHEFYNGRELAMHFENARFKVIPKERGAEVRRL